MLRVTSEAGDSIYSFETQADRPAVAQFLAGNRGRLACYKSSDVLDSLAPSGRSVTSYSLNLTPREACRLDSLLKVNSGRLLERFNMRSANCTTVLFDLIDSAITPSVVTLGHSAVFGLPAARFYTDTLRRSAPWVTALITLTLGADADAPVSDVRSVSPLIFDDQYHFFNIRDKAATRPLVKETVKLQPQLIHSASPAITPDLIAVILALLLMTASILSITGKCDRLVTTTDTVVFGTIFLAGSLITFATFTPYRMGASWAWSLTVLNPLIILFPRFRRTYPRAYRIIASVWAIWLTGFAIFGAKLTAEALPFLRILAPAIAIRVLTLR